jgi:uncharacterized protein YbaR (Trm112 family)
VFIEVAELLRCPAGHPATHHCVLLPTRIEARVVWEGMIGCPVCETEYPIVDGVVMFGPAPAPAVTPSALPDPEALHAFLGLTTPGGVVVLLGAVAEAAPALGARLDGVHIITLNGPASVAGASGVTRLVSGGGIPLRDGVARAVVADATHAASVWTVDAVRVAQSGARVVVLATQPTVPDCDELASAAGVWVGTRRPLRSQIVPLRQSS